MQKVQRILKLKDTQANKGKLVNLEIILMYIQHHFLKISVRVRNNKENSGLFIKNIKDHSNSYVKTVKFMKKKPISK